MKKDGDLMNRVLLCGACVAAVRRLLGEECAQVPVVTASDGSIAAKVAVTSYEKKDGGAAQARICRKGICYLAEASFDTEPGITLEYLGDTKIPVMFRLTARYPGIVCLLMQNIGLQAKNEGVIVQIDVIPEQE